MNRVPLARRVQIINCMVEGSATPSLNAERPVARIASLARAMIGCHCSADRVGDRTVAAIVVDQRIADSGSGGRVGVWLAGGRLCGGDGMGRR
jgi:hypothetical protein